MALVIELDEEIQGHIDATDVLFASPGDPVPLTPPPSAFDLSDPPRHPIAISFPDRLLFVANSQGFMVAETPEVIRMSKEIKEKGKGPSVLDSCLLDVKIGKVSILALSVDSLWLAAVVGSDVRFYSVDCLRKKESNFSLMFSIKSGVVKDFKWQKNTEKAFLILSSHGSLHLGHLQAPLKDVMDNVDAVDWSETGAFIAVAKKNTLSILSRDLKEQCELKLLFQSWSDDTDSECSIKVDSINWLRNDSIVIGCVRVFEDGKEESYLVQVIAFRELEFTEGSSKPVVFSFPDLFAEISDDILPTGYGPYLLVSYLKHFGFTLASIKKAIGSHLLLVGWVLKNDLKEAVSFEYANERYPRIELQENGDDNLILGFVVDQTPSNEKVNVKIEANFKEVVPNCTLWCLTSEGKLILFHIMRISDPSDRPETISSPNDYKGVDEITSSAVTVKDQLPATTLRLKDGVDGEIPFKESEPPENLEKFSNADDNILIGKKVQGTAISSAQLYVAQRLNAEKLPVVSSHVQDPGSILESNARLGIQESCFTGQTLSTASSIGSLSSEAFTTKQVDTRVLEKKAEKELVGSTSGQGALFGSQSTGKLVFAGNSNSKSSSSVLDGSALGNIYGSAKIGSENKLPSYQHGPISDEILPGGKPFNFKVSSSPPPPSMVSENKTIQSEGAATFLGKARNSEPLLAMHKPLPFPLQGSMPGKSLNSMVQPSLDNSRNHRSTWMVESGTELPKQFYNVKNMAKELDNLLSFIEREGGFRDACTVLQESSLLALKDGLQNLSMISQVHKNKIEKQLLEIQQLQTKMLQVSTRQVYVEGLVKQASNDQYWDIWKQQKLSPELEMKRQHIFDIYQGLTNQLIGLERHFNTLEISKFGENGGVRTGRRAFHANVDPLRHAQSFQKVYNTLNSQLAAAEQLSNCLSEQMAMLNINPPSVRHPTVVKELFESIGLSQEASIFHSPESIKRTSASASTAKGHSKINTLSTSKVLESGTMRRRYSLDKSLSKFEPPKTIVKRMLKESDVIVVADKHVRTSREAFHSQTAGYAINLQKSNETHASSFSNPSMPIFHSVAYPTSKGTEGKPCKEAFELMPSFKWTMEHSGSTHNMKSDSHLDQPTFSSSPSAFFSNLHGIADGNFQLADSSSNVATHSVSQSGSSTVFKTAPYSKEMANLLSNSFPPTQTSVTFSGSSTPNMKTTLLSQKAEDKTSDQFSQKPGKDGPTKLSARSSDHLGVSEKGLISVSDESTHSLQSGVRPVDGNRIAQVDVLKSQSESSETSSTLSHSVASELTPLFSTKQSSTSLTSSHSPTPILPFFSSSSISSASISSTYIPASSTLVFCEQSSFDTKPVKETQNTPPVPSSTSAPSSPSLFPSSKPFAVQSYKSLVPTSSAIPFDSAVSQSPSLQRNVANSSSESTQLQASEAEVLLQTKEASPLSKPVISQASTVKVSVGLTEGEPSVVPIASVSTFPPTSRPPEIQSATISPLSMLPQEKDEGIDLGSSQEDEMEEEAPNMANAFNLGALGGFGLGSTSPILQKPNPFGGSFSTPPISSPFSLTTSPGELFRPASLSIPPAKPIELSQPTQSGATSGGFGGFGQPANIGSGQQALGSVLGAFGQSRQLGMGFASSGGFGSGGFSGAANSGGGFNAAGAGGGFAGAATGGGFAGAATGGGFAAAGGFAGANIGGGFAAVASQGGGFAAVASGSSGGFGGASPGGGGFSAGGFGAFSSNQGAGFSGFGGNNAAGTGGPPAQLFTQMRK